MVKEKCRMGLDGLKKTCRAMGMIVANGAIDTKTLQVKLLGESCDNKAKNDPLVIIVDVCPSCGARLQRPMKKRRKKIAQQVPAVPVGGQLPIAFGRRSR